MQRRAGLVLLLLAISGGLASTAEACVLKIVSTGTSRSMAAAVGQVVSADVHGTVQECNEYAGAVLAALGESAERNGIIESITVECVVPASCYAPDVDDVEPYLRVLILKD
ncbi:hypothetical protein [Devosia sp. CAU 1758]